MQQWTDNKKIGRKKRDAVNRIDSTEQIKKLIYEVYSQEIR